MSLINAVGRIETTGSGYLKFDRNVGRTALEYPRLVMSARTGMMHRTLSSYLVWYRIPCLFYCEATFPANSVCIPSSKFEYVQYCTSVTYDTVVSLINYHRFKYCSTFHLHTYASGTNFCATVHSTPEWSYSVTHTHIHKVI